VKSILHAHHAEVDVKSTIGQGTTFVVTIPRARAGDAKSGPGA